MTKFYDYPTHVLHPACGQEEAYEIMGIKEVLESFLFEDEDACIIAYGQTGNILSVLVYHSQVHLIGFIFRIWKNPHNVWGWSYSR